MGYELYYHASIQGRGEFVRLALEEGGASYTDIGRQLAEQGGGQQAVLAMMGDAGGDRPPFAPPILKDGDYLVSHTANILMYVGNHIGLAPADEQQRHWLHGLQLTITDFIKDVHDTHHPLSNALFYEEQKDEAAAANEKFHELRVPKYFGYFEIVIARNSSASGWLVGDALSYGDTSIYHLVEGMNYAWPKRWASVAGNYPGMCQIRNRVAARPNIQSYLASERRIPFNTNGVFRHYPELDR